MRSVNGQKRSLSTYRCFSEHYCKKIRGHKNGLNLSFPVPKIVQQWNLKLVEKHLKKSYHPNVNRGQDVL